MITNAAALAEHSRLKGYLGSSEQSIVLLLLLLLFMLAPLRNSWHLLSTHKQHTSHQNPAMKYLAIPIDMVNCDGSLSLSCCLECADQWPVVPRQRRTAAHSHRTRTHHSHAALHL
jgi:hypothetical protein